MYGDVLKSEDLLKIGNRFGDVIVTNFEGSVEIVDQSAVFNKIIFVDCRIKYMVIASTSFAEVNFYGCKIDDFNMLASRCMGIMFNNSKCGLIKIYSDAISGGLEFIGEETVVDYIEIGTSNIGRINTRDLLETSREHLMHILKKSWFSVCPEEGSFIAYKKAIVNDPDDPDGDNITYVIIKLLIPEVAKRISPFFTRKCRCDKALVIEITDNDGKQYALARSGYNKRFTYFAGKTAHADRLEEDLLIECSNGIHFFMTKDEAVKYPL